MLYPFMTLDDNTQIVHSETLPLREDFSMPKVFDLGPYTIYFWVGRLFAAIRASSGACRRKRSIRLSSRG